jgi:hypothetical protein
MQRGIAVLTIFLLLAASAHAVLPGDPGFRGCVIGTAKGALQDIDCDRTPDAFDNCPLTPNPEQVDRDKNGIGDSCDLIIDEIRIEPDTPQQGRSFVTSIALTNNRAYPMRNMVVKVDVPALGIATSEDIAQIQPGERVRRELVLRAPDCAPLRFTDIVAIAEYPYAPGQKEVFSQPVKVPFVSGGTCAAETGSDKTVVNILEIQDVDPINGALYPFTIHNTQSESKAYVLSVQGLESWGYSEIHPNTVIVVPAGEARDGALQIWSRPGIEGRRSFTFTIQARDDMKQIMLLANIPQGAAYSEPKPQLLAGIIVFLILLLVIAAILTYTKKMKKK